MSCFFLFDALCKHVDDYNALDGETQMKTVDEK